MRGASGAVAQRVGCLQVRAVQRAARRPRAALACAELAAAPHSTRRPPRRRVRRRAAREYTQRRPLPDETHSHSIFF